MTMAEGISMNHCIQDIVARGFVRAFASTLRPSHAYVVRRRISVPATVMWPASIL